MREMKKIVFLLTVFAAFVLNGQTVKFQKVFNLDSFTVIKDVVQSSAGGYIACGSVANSKFYFVSKLDQNGQILWTRKIDGMQMNHNAYRIKESATGDILMLGIRDSSAWSYLINLIKLDQSGNVLWNRIYYGSSQTWLQTPSMRELENGDFIISSKALVFSGSNEYYVSLMRVDPNGNIIWSKMYSSDFTSKPVYSYDLEISKNKTSILSVGTGPYYKMYLVNVDMNGALLWSKTYDLPGSSLKGFSVHKTKDNDFVIAVETNTDAPGLIKIDTAGNVLWAKTYKNAQFLSFGAGCVEETTDGGIAFTTNKSLTFSMTFPVLMKTSSSGNFLWAKSYTLGITSLSSYPYFNMKQTSDKGFILAENAADSISGKVYPWLIKTDSLGFTGCGDVSLQFTATPITLNVTNTVQIGPSMITKTISVPNISVNMTYSINCSNFIDELSENSEIGHTFVFPNPSNGKIKIKNPKDLEKLEIYDIHYRLLYSENIQLRKDEEFEIDIRTLSKGIYFLKAISNDRIFFTKVIKE